MDVLDRQRTDGRDATGVLVPLPLSGLARP